MTTTHNHTARREDLDFLASHGVGTEEAAHRLNTTRMALEKWCRHHQALDLWSRLCANDARTATSGTGARPGRVRADTR